MISCGFCILIFSYPAMEIHRYRKNTCEDFCAVLLPQIRGVAGDLTRHLPACFSNQASIELTKLCSINSASATLDLHTYLFRSPQNQHVPPRSTTLYAIRVGIVMALRCVFSTCIPQASSVLHASRKLRGLFFRARRTCTSSTSLRYNCFFLPDDLPRFYV